MAQNNYGEPPKHYYTKVNDAILEQAKSNIICILQEGLDNNYTTKEAFNEMDVEKIIMQANSMPC